MDDKPKNAALQQGVNVCQRRGMSKDIKNVVAMTGNQWGVFCQYLSYIVEPISPAGQCIKGAVVQDGEKVGQTEILGDGSPVI